MTLPDERYSSLIRARDFLRSLLDPKATPKVPSTIRKEAGRRLRHYPNEYYMEKLREKSPEILGPSEEKTK